MPDSLRGPEKSIEAAEIVRKAREFAWVASLVYPVMAAMAYVNLLWSVQMGYGNPPDNSELIMLDVAAILLLSIHLRMIFVAIRLGGNLKDPDYLISLNTDLSPAFYFFRRLFGLRTKGSDAPF